MYGPLRSPPPPGAAPGRGGPGSCLAGGVRGGCSDLAGSPSAARSSLPSEAHLGLRQPFPWRGKRGAARRLPVRALQRAAASQVHRAVDCRACWPHRPAMPRSNTASCARCSTPDSYPLSSSCPEHSSAAPPQSAALGSVAAENFVRERGETTFSESYVLRRRQRWVWFGGEGHGASHQVHRGGHYEAPL